MAIIPSSRYPAQTDIAAAYPQGKARNAGSYQDGTGTPLEKDWVNDQFGFHQALLDAAAIVPSGSPDQVGASQYLDAVRSVAARAATDQALRGFLSTCGVIALDDVPPVGVGLAAVYDEVTGLTLISVGGVNGSHVVADDMRGDTQATSGTVTGVVAGAMDPIARRVVLVGNGGAFACSSTNFGTGWTNATTAPVSSRNRIVWDATHGLFLASGGTANISTSPTGATWTTRALTGSAYGGVAVLPSGVGLASIGSAAALAFNVSANGTTWTLSAGTLPNLASIAAVEEGCLCSLGNLFYHSARFTSGNELRIHSSPDGVNWALVSTITHPSFPLAANTTRILADKQASVLYALAGISGAPGYMLVWMSLDAGATWIGPARYLTWVDFITAAGGRLFANGGVVTRCTANRLPLA